MKVINYPKQIPDLPDERDAWHNGAFRERVSQCLPKMIHNKTSRTLAMSIHEIHCIRACRTLKCIHVKSMLTLKSINPAHVNDSLRDQAHIRSRPRQPGLPSVCCHRGIQTCQHPAERSLLHDAICISRSLCASRCM